MNSYLTFHFSTRSNLLQSQEIGPLSNKYGSLTVDRNDTH